MLLTVLLYLMVRVGLSLPTYSKPQQALSPLDALPYSLSEDDSFNFQLLVDLGIARYGAGNPADILAAAQVVKPGDFSGFNSTFYKLANHSEAVANLSSPTNAAETYFAASSYWRTADFYNHGNWNDPNIAEYWKHQTYCFDKAIATLTVPGERVSIPADGFDTIGIFYGQVKNSTKKYPTIIIGNGYDAAQEDSYHMMAITALQQGWNILTYEGPGQPTVRRDQNKGFIYDWEKVVTPAVDYLANRSDVDMDRLALVGISMGGYLAARAAAFEPRIKALLLNDGVYDVYEAYSRKFGPLKQLFESGNKTAFDGIVNEAVTFNTSADSTGRWGVQQGLWSYNTHSPYEWLKVCQKMTLANITDKIQMPTWIGNAVNDASFPGQPAKVKQALGDRATLHNFTGPASYHCEAGAFDVANQVMFDWLNDVLSLK